MEESYWNLNCWSPKTWIFSTTKGNFMYCLMMIRLDPALLFREYNSLLFHWICVLIMSFSTASQRGQNFCHASLKNQKLWLLIIALKVLRISLWAALTWGKRRHFTIFVGKNGSAAPISSIYRILTPVRRVVNANWPTYVAGWSCPRADNVCFACRSSGPIDVDHGEQALLYGTKYYP